MASPYGSSLSADDGAIIMLRRKRRRTRSVLLLSGLLFLVAIVVDGILQLYSYSPPLDEEYYRVHHFNSNFGEAQSFIGGESVARGLLRRLGLVKSLLSPTSTTRMVRRGVIPHDLDERSIMSNESNGNEQPQQQQQQQPQQQLKSVTNKSSHIKLHTFPLLPAHALRHRRRRELMDHKLPIPESLRLPEQRQRTDHETTTTSSRRRTREYDNPNEVISIPTSWTTPGLTRTLYNTGALYQGYGTHYIDLWIGSPIPQRQTMIVDTGSSITAFPCSGCNDCGNSASASTTAASSSSSSSLAPQQHGKSYHTDDVYQTSKSTSYIEKQCTRDAHLLKKDVCDYGYCIKAPFTNGSNANIGRCEVTTSYAEGSSWTALEGEDVVYPAVGGSSSSMGDVEVEDGTSGIPQWLDFRLKFGCQEKVSCFSFSFLYHFIIWSHLSPINHPSSLDVTFVQVTGFFRTQLEDGIMGMNNKDAAFWFQLREHYKQMGYDNSNNDNDGVHASGVADQFNPSQFSLCYDRQPISKNLDHGLGSGTLTLGGSDPLLHNTPMVYASNITPDEGWYKVRITAMFLRTNGGTLLSVSSLTSIDTTTTTMTATDGVATDIMPRYLRVHATEDDLNGGSDPQQGVIIDSGTTDTYLPQTLAGSFQQAWVDAMGGIDVYDNTPRELTIKQLRSLPTILIILRGHAPSNVDNLEKGAIGMTHSHVSMFTSEEYPISDADIVVAMPPGHYMEESSSTPGMYTSRLYFTERPGSQSILGSNFLMGHDVLFDNGQGRIGFAESHCDYTRYVKEKNTIIQQEHAGLEGQGR